MDNLLTRLSDLEEWADANEYEVPINLGDTLREAMEEIRRMTEERDEVMKYIPHNCGTCLHLYVSSMDNANCDIGGPTTCHWEWRGCTRPESKEDVCTKN